MTVPDLFLELAGGTRRIRVDGMLEAGLSIDEVERFRIPVSDRGLFVVFLTVSPVSNCSRTMPVLDSETTECIRRRLTLETFFSGEGKGTLLVLIDMLSV